MFSCLVRELREEVAWSDASFRVANLVRRLIDEDDVTTNNFHFSEKRVLDWAVVPICRHVFPRLLTLTRSIMR